MDIKKYRGVEKVKARSGRDYYRVAFRYRGVIHKFGRYRTQDECARAHDMYIMKMNLDRPMNFFKKKIGKTNY